MIKEMSEEMSTDSVTTLPDIFQSIYSRLAHTPEQEEKKEETIKKLQETLECPICLEPALQPPIYSCPVGHILCSDCYSCVTKCPLCAQGLQDAVTARNTGAEILSYKLAMLENKDMVNTRKARMMMEVRKDETPPGIFSMQKFL